MSSLINSEKEQDFNWLLIEIVNALSTDDQKDFIRAHRGIVLSSSSTGDLKNECHLVLNSLVADKKFGPDNLDGLKKRLKKLGRDDLIKSCTLHIAKTKKEKKKALKFPIQASKADKMYDNLEQELIKAKSQICALVAKSTEAINICEEKFRKFCNNDPETTEKEVRDTFRRFDSLINRSTSTLARGISGSSLLSDRSETGSLDERSLYDRLSPKLVEAQEEEGAYSIVPLPRRGSHVDNTGDSGLGSNEGNRDEWLKGSMHPDLHMTKQAWPTTSPRNVSPLGPGQYSSLLTTDKRQLYSEPIKATATSVDELLDELERELKITQSP